MKRQVSQGAIEDLIHSTHRTSKLTLKILQSLKPVVPLIEDNCAGVAADIAIQSHTKPGGAEISTESAIRELENHYHKEAVLDAAIAELSKTEWQIKRLKKLRPVVRRIFKNLDPRTKALFTIYEMLISVDGVTLLDYFDTLRVFGDAPVDCLKDDPAMTPLLEAHELACDVVGLLQKN